MMDNAPNPYAAGALPATISARSRPIGITLLAFILSVFGLITAASTVVKFVEVWAWAPPDLFAKMSEIAILSVVSIAAALGLISGRRTGWWVAITFCYYGLAEFVLLSLVRSGFGELLPRKLIYVAMFGGCWIYLHSGRVLRYFSHTEAPSWQTHAALLAGSTLVVFTLGSW